MMKRIMTHRVAALALAAIPLTAAPALADQPGRTATSTAGLSVGLADAGIYVSIGDDRRRGYGRHHGRTNHWNQPRWEVRQMRRHAIRRCAGAIKRKGYRFGYHDIEIDDDVRARQIGPRGFRVRFDEVEFEGRRRDFERRVSCTVRRGHVVSVDGFPRPGRRGHRYHRDDRRHWDRDYRPRRGDWYDD